MEDSDKHLDQDSPVEVHVKGCARCGHDHHVNFRPFKLQRPEIDQYSHWGTCPVMFEPIVLQMVEKPCQPQKPKRKSKK